MPAQPLSPALVGGFSSHGRPHERRADSAHRARKAADRANAEAQRQHQLGQAFLLAVGRAATSAEQEALEREYQERLAAGPDWRHHRKGSSFTAAPPHRLDRNAIAALRYRFNSMARKSWEQRREGKHRGLISRTCKDVFGALLWLAERHPRLFPSLLCIASLAQCCKQSVVTALRVLEDLGFITRHRRLRRVQGLLGVKVEQASNAYELHPPQPGRGRFAWLFSLKPRRESNNSAVTALACLSYLSAHPETWGSPGIARSDAHGGPPKAAHF